MRRLKLGDAAALGFDRWGRASPVVDDLITSDSSASGSMDPVNGLVSGSTDPSLRTQSLRTQMSRRRLRTDGDGPSSVPRVSLSISSLSPTSSVIIAILQALAMAMDLDQTTS